MARNRTLSKTLIVDGKEMHVDKALAEGIKRGQCIECNEEVMPREKMKTGAHSHVRHLNRNKKCSLSDTKDSKILRKKAAK